MLTCNFKFQTRQRRRIEDTSAVSYLEEEQLRFARQRRAIISGERPPQPVNLVGSVLRIYQVVLQPVRQHDDADAVVVCVICVSADCNA